MQKITTLLVSLAISLTTIGQETAVLKELKTTFSKQKSATLKKEIIGEIYFSEDFSSDAWENSVVEDGNGFLYNPAATMPAGFSAVSSSDPSRTNAGYIHWSSEGPRGAHTTGSDNNWETPDNSLFNILPDGSTYDNGVLLLESDYANTTEDGGITSNVVEVDSYIQYGPLDLSDAPGAIFSCNNIFRICCASDAMLALEVSTDYDEANPSKGTWEVYQINAQTPGNDYTIEKDTHFPVSERSVEINISAQILGSDNVWFRLRQSVSSHYFWIIDDLKIYEPEAQDLKLTDGFADYAFYPVNVSNDNATNFFGGYTTIPERVAAPFPNFRNALLNNGTEDITGAQLKASIYKDGEFVEDFKGLKKDLIKFEFDTVSVQTVYTPTEKGSYQVSLTTTYDGGIANSGWKYDFEIVDNIYSTVYRANSNTFGTAGPSDWESGGWDGDACVQEYYVPKTAGETKAAGINIFIPSYEGYDDEKEDIKDGYFSMVARIWVVNDAGEIVPSDIRSSIYNLKSTDLGNWVTINFEDEGNLWLAPEANYYVGVECYTSSTPTGNDRRLFLIGKDVNGPKQPYGGGLVFLSNATTPAWSGTGDNYAIELILRNWNVGIEDELNQNKVELYPNPINDKLTISNLDNAKEVIITNVVGQTLQVIEVSETQLVIPTNDLNTGIYMITVIDKQNNANTYRIVKH